MAYDLNPLVNEPARTRQILDKIRSRITAGQYLPDQKMPTFAEMEIEFNVGRAVLQQVVASLKQDGFVRSENRRGLFVVQNPPHLHQYGLLFSATPGHAGWCRLMTALTREVERIEQNDSFARFCTHFGLHAPDARRNAARQISDDIRACRLAGLILTPETFGILEEPELRDADIPIVQLWSFKTADPRITHINTDAVSLLKRSLQHLKNSGRQRIAVLHMADTTAQINHADLYADAGLDFHPPWVQHVGRSHPQLAANIISVLMDYRHDVRPDGLIIADDSLVEPAIQGLHTCEISVEKDIDIVAHSNWPWPPKNSIPMTRIGFDIRDIVRRALHNIGMRTRGEVPPKLEVLPALFEWEVDPLK